MLDLLDATTVRRWAVVTRAAFAARQGQLNALNVFPVPDGDTGTNLYLSLDAALDDIRAQQEADGTLRVDSVAAECAALGRALLISARGNSGVIFSQFASGFAEVFTEYGADVADATAIAAGLRRSAELARASVMHPLEGTILTVADRAADAAAEVVARGGTLAELTQSATAAAKEALARTPEQLPALGRAGVVDAGGAGYLLLLEALDRIVREVAPASAYAVDAFMDPAAPVVAPPQHDLAADGPAYEVMYLLSESDAGRVGTLRSALDGLGDSLLVIGGPDLWNVHVHVDDVGAAIEAGIDAGRPQRIRVTHFADQAGVPREISELGVVACAAGPGIEAIFAAAGAVPVASGPGHRASAGQLLQGITATHAREVILLTNDRDTVMAAQAAAKAAAQDGVVVHVVGSRTAVQGLAAMAVFDPSQPTSANVVAMTSASAGTRHGGLTVAAKDGYTSGGECHIGDILGVVAGDIVIVGSDRAAVAGEVVRRLLSGGGELLTMLTGAAIPDGLAAAVEATVAREFPLIEVQVLDGGQPAYELLVGVE